MRLPPAQNALAVLTVLVGAAVLLYRPFHPISRPSPRVPQRFYGIASWYGGAEALNRRAANGEPFDRGALTAALWGAPFGAHARITNLLNGRAVTVEITDRGPAWWLPGRVVDLSPAAFSQLSPLKRGLIPVAVEWWCSN